jgi:hypothetical protein
MLSLSPAWITILGGIATVIGGIMIAYPVFPKFAGISLIIIGLVVSGYGIYELNQPVKTSTFIKLSPEQLIAKGEYFESNNINYISSMGYGDFTFHFKEPIDENFTISISGHKTIDFKLIEKTSYSARIKFNGAEPDIVKLIFE